MTLQTAEPSSANTKMPALAQGVLAGPQRERFDPEGAGSVLLMILNLADAAGLDAAPFCPMNSMTSALGVSRIVLLLTVTTPWVISVSSGKFIKQYC